MIGSLQYSIEITTMHASSSHRGRADSIIMSTRPPLSHFRFKLSTFVYYYEWRWLYKQTTLQLTCKCLAPQLFPIPKNISQPLSPLPYQATAASDARTEGEKWNILLQQKQEPAAASPPWTNGISLLTQSSLHHAMATNEDTDGQSVSNASVIKVNWYNTPTLSLCLLFCIITLDTNQPGISVLLQRWLLYAFIFIRFDLLLAYSKHIDS